MKMKMMMVMLEEEEEAVVVVILGLYDPPPILSKPTTPSHQHRNQHTNDSVFLLSLVLLVVFFDPSRLANQWPKWMGVAQCPAKSLGAERLAVVNLAPRVYQFCSENCFAKQKQREGFCILV